MRDPDKNVPAHISKIYVFWDTLMYIAGNKGRTKKCFAIFDVMVQKVISKIVVRSAKFIMGEYFYGYM